MHSVSRGIPCLDVLTHQNFELWKPALDFAIPYELRLPLCSRQPDPEPTTRLRRVERNEGDGGQSWRREREEELRLDPCGPV
jgi:hypothetical protein